MVPPPTFIGARLANETPVSVAPTTKVGFAAHGAFLFSIRYSIETDSSVIPA